MVPVTATDFAGFLKLTAAEAAKVQEELQEDVDTATEYVESLSGPLADRVLHESMCQSAILQLAKHLRGIRQTATSRGSMYGSSEQVPSVVGYLIPNRVKSLIDAIKYDDPNMIGIG